MLNKNLPLPSAFFRLLELTRSEGMAYAETTALVWLAVARLYASDKNRFGSDFSLEKLQSETGWAHVFAAGLLPEAALLVQDRRTSGLKSTHSTRDAISIVEALCRDLDGAPDSAWDVLPFLFSSDRRNPKGNDLFMEQSVVELIVDMLKGVSGSIWVPFDTSGQIAITALRRGYEVLTAGITANEHIIRHLLTCIETGSAKHPRLITEVSRDARGRPTICADFIIANPPMGYSVREGHWGQWQSDEGNILAVHDRSEAWTIHHLTGRAKQKLIMFSSQNWLFSMGQERRLREGLIEKSDVNLDTVVTLPSGAVSASNIATAIASVSHGRSSGFIHMIDVKSESRTEGFATLLERYRPAILNLNEIQKNSRLIPLEEIREADYVLLPQRIFRTIEMSSVNLVSLGEICESIRPPTPYRGQDGITVIELGIPNLRDGEWNPIVRNDPRTEKWNTANPMTRNESFLASNDILLSVKGTLGLARLVSDKYGASESGDQSEKIRAVVSTSCIALRLSKQTQRSVISPQYLLMYLRSSEGQEQIRSLQVGTGMPHISNQTLMNAFRIPIPSLKDQADVVEEFEMLCKLEFKIQTIKQKMERMIESRWIVKLA